MKFGRCINTKTNLISGWYFIVCDDVALLGHHFFFHDDLTFIVQFAIEPKSSVP